MKINPLPEDQTLLGKRIKINIPHPWSGNYGEIIRWEEMPFGNCPVVRLENGYECFVIDRDEMEFLP